jgi:hypothetical protein
MRAIQAKRTVLFVAVLMIAALAAGPAAPASAQACDIPTSGEYTIHFDCVLAGTIEVDGSLTIYGDGHTINANGNQAFIVDNGESLALDSVTVTYGYDGAVVNEGTLTIGNSTFYGNVAFSGGVIYNDGIATIDNSTFYSNQADRGGGAIENWGRVTVSNSTFYSNEATDGGAIFNRGKVTVSNSSFYGNYASNWGGAIYNGTGSVTVRECSVFRGNSAFERADGIGNYYNGMVNVTGSVIYNEVYDLSVYDFSVGRTVVEDNWWGSADGPGAWVYNSTVDTWLTENPCTTEDAPPVCETVMPFGTVDPAPINGEVRFFTGYYGPTPQPTGVQSTTVVEAVAGEQTWGEVTVFCGSGVRAWLFDTEGNVVGLVPSQHENGDGAFDPWREDYRINGPEYGYYGTAPPIYTHDGPEYYSSEPIPPPMYTGRYADMFTVDMLTEDW